jgi:MFS family permease
MNIHHPGNSRPRFFYGWVVVAVSFITLAVTYAISHGFSIFYVAILQEFGWSRADTALAYSLNRIVNGLTSPLAGSLTDRFGPRVLIPVGGVILATGLALTSQLHALWQYYLYYGVIVAIGISCTGMIPNTALLANWFERRRGLAMGISFAGIGIGMFLIVPGAQALISAFGWRWSYLGLAGLVLLVPPTLNIVFQRLRPQDMRLLPDGGRAGGIASGGPRRVVEIVDEVWVAREWTISAALRTRRFWLLFATQAFALIATQTWMVHQVALIVDAKFDPLVAASTFGFVGLCASGGKIIWGTLADVLNREWAYTIGSVATGAGLLALLGLSITHEFWLLVAFALLFGAGQGTIAPLFSLMGADLFQGRNFGAIWGALFIGVSIGTAVGPWLGGLAYDTYGNYNLALLGTLAALVISVVLAWLTGPRQIRRLAPAGGVRG